MKKRLLALLLAVAMVFGMFPATVLAAEQAHDHASHTHEVAESAQTYEVCVTMNALATHAKLYSWTEGTKGDTNLLADVANQDNSYELALAPGEYVLEGYNADDSLYYGSIVISVNESSKEFQVYTVTGIKATNEGWVAGTDYTITPSVMSKDMTADRQAQLGSDANGATLLCLYMDSVSVTYAAVEELHPGYGEQTRTETIYSNTAEGLSAELSELMDVTIIAPAGSTVQIAAGGYYYNYEVYEPLDVQEEGDTQTNTFRVPGGTVRASHPDGVLTWFWADEYENLKVKDEAVLTLTKEDLRIGNAYDVIRRADGNNSLDQADVRLNINEKGYLNLAVGETFEVNATRVWQAVYTYMNEYTGMPDFNYVAIDPVTGEESDILEIVSRDPVTWQADITAKAEGTAIVLVTYDAMYDPMTMGGGKLSATWPENTGVFVVTVGADGSAIDTGMKINEDLGFTAFKLAGEYIDAEMDVLYYAEGTDGASYSFTPESGATVTILHPTVTDDAMTYSGGFGTEGVEVNAETGEVTLTGLTIGRHIVKVEKDGLSTYQVISAKPVSYTITDAEGEELTADSIVDAGETITITYTGLYNPAEKQSGVYNFTSRVFLVDDAANITYNREPGTMGVYTFNSTKQTINVVIPASWSEDTITLTGGIATSAFGGPAGTHRVVDYDVGLGQNAYNNEQRAHLCALPPVTLNVKTNDGRIEGKLIPMDGETVIEGAKMTLTAENGDNITVKADGSFKVVPGTYKYTVDAEGYQYLTGEIKVTLASDNQFVIEMTALDEKAWDGKTTTEPSKNEEGWYEISTGAEFVWYANAITGGTITEYNAILTDDIDLGGYPFTPIKTFASDNTLDGDGHTIKNLFVDQDSSGYILGIGGLVNTLNGTFQNLTVDGKVTYRTAYEGVFVGSIAGYLSADYKSTTGGHLINVVSNVDLTVIPTYSGWYAKYHVGGLVGGNANGMYVKAKGSIENCINNGTITVLDSDGRFNACYVGGLMGQISNMIDILDSANHGEINVSTISTNTVAIGGIIGQMSGKYANRSELRAVYNSGDINVTATKNCSISGISASVTYTNVNGVYNSGDFNVTSSDGASYVYGLVGSAPSGTFQNGYNIGEFNCDDNVIASNAYGANVYYLDTSSVTNGSGSAISEEEFKTVNLGQYLLATCDGYPEVYWKDANFHVKGEEVGTVEADCLLNSATVYECTECGVEFAYGETYDASGHTLCNHTSVEDVEACEFCEYLVVPTCTTTGTIKRICQNEGCAVEVVSNANAFGHYYCWHQTQEQLDANPDCPGHSMNEPKCNDPGLVRMVCTRCAEPIPSNYAAPVIYKAHTVDYTTKTEVPGENYDNYKCADCGGTLRVYHTLDTSGDYPWVYDEEDGRWESTITAPNKGSSAAKITVENASYGALIAFDYGCNTGSSRYKLVTNDGSSTSREYYEVDSGSFIGEMREMLNSVYNFTYKRNRIDETTTGNDFAWIDNVVVHVHVADPTNVTEENLITEATCTEPGQIYNICADCGMLTDIKISSEPLGHDLKAKVIKPTCTEGGYTEYACQREGCTYNERNSYTAPAGHDYEATITFPTESEQGYTTYTCLTCGDSYVADYTDPIDRPTVLFSASNDAVFLTGEGNDQVMALQQIEVPYFDLALYGLEDYYLDGSETAAYGKITMLHLFLYATEVYQCGLDADEAGRGYLYDQSLLGTDVLTVSGGNGSLLVDQFWGMDLNLNYYLNYEYPLESEKWGATADQIVLSDGDVVTVGHFSDWAFYGDTMSGFNYVTADTTVVSEGERISFRVYRAGADFSGDYATAQTLRGAGIKVYYTTLEELSDGDVTTWTYLGTTDENGQVTVEHMSWDAGEYLIGVPGQPGAESEAICSAPGGMRLTVEACRHAEFTDTITAPTHDAMGYTTHTCTVCGYTYLDSFTAALDHEYTQTVTKEPTCTAEGELTFTCEECGISYTQILPKLDHAYETVVIDPTCEQIGYTTHTCTACGHSYVSGLTQPVGHTVEVQGRQEATWHEDGYTGDTVCTVCGDILEAGQVIPALGCASDVYSDVEDGTWYHEAVDYVTGNGIMNGMGNGTFAPAATTNRAMMAVLLYRLAGEPSVEGLENPFTDVEAGSWFYDAVVWAASEGIVNGKSANIFAPADDVTREQMVTMLYRYCGSPETDPEALNGYTDAGTVSAFAKDAFAWAIENGIISGMTATTLVPTVNTNRAQIAVILMRFCEKIAA